MAELQMEEVGKAVAFFAHPSVAIIEVARGSLKVGDQIYIKGHTTDFKQTITSMQIEHAVVQEAKVGDAVGIQVTERVRKGDTVYKL